MYKIPHQNYNTQYKYNRFISLYHKGHQVKYFLPQNSKSTSVLCFVRATYSANNVRYLKALLSVTIKLEANFAYRFFIKCSCIGLHPSCARTIRACSIKRKHNAFLKKSTSTELHHHLAPQKLELGPSSEKNYNETLPSKTNGELVSAQ